MVRRKRVNTPAAFNDVGQFPGSIHGPSSVQEYRCDT